MTPEAELADTRLLILGLLGQPSFAAARTHRANARDEAYQGHREFAWRQAVNRARAKDETLGRYRRVRLLRPWQGGQPGEVGRMLATDAKFAVRKGVAELADPAPTCSTTGPSGGPSTPRVTTAGLCTSIERLQRPWRVRPA